MDSLLLSKVAHGMWGRRKYPLKGGWRKKLIYKHLNIPLKKEYGRDFLGGTVVKNPPANAGDTGSIPGPGRSHMPRSN